MQENFFSHFLTGGGTLFGYTTDLNLAPTSAVRLTSSILTRSHCDFSMQLTLKPVFFNRGSAEPNGSASGIQGFRRTVGAQQKKLNCARHLRPLDAFSGLLVCICGRGSAQRELTALLQIH